MKRLLLFAAAALSLRGQIQIFNNGELNGSVRAKINSTFLYLGSRVCTAIAPAFSAAPTFDLSASPCVIKPGAMSTNVAVAAFTHFAAGQKFSITWTQPPSGGPFNVTYPGYVSRACNIWGTANSTVTQQFEVEPDAVNIRGTGCAGSDNLLEFLPVALPSSGKSGSYLVALNDQTHTLYCNYNDTGWTLCSAVPTPLVSGSGSGVLTGPRQYFVCTNTCTVTPPVPASGYEFCVMNDSNVTSLITLAALGSGAMYGNAERTAYGTPGTGTLANAGSTGDKVCLLGLDATHYLIASSQGTWTAN